VTDVDLTFAVMTVPSRAHLVPRILEHVPDAVVVIDEAETGDTWAMYQACLAAGERGSHRCVIQDDCLLVDDFAALALVAVSGRPKRVVCLYTPALPSPFGRAIMAARAKGHEYAELTQRMMFVPLVCTSWPVALADEFSTWPRHASFRAGPTGRADDARAADWFNGTKRYAVASVPCLADHDELAPSALNNGGRYSRRAAVLPDTPAGELTIA
jgi:hypothetical protein